MLRVPSPLAPETEELVHSIIGCALAVHRELGPGFLESVYRRAICLELDSRGLTFETEKPILVRYRQWSIPGQRVDLVVESQVIVEIKAVQRLDPTHEAQLISYLRTTGLRIGLLMNFRSYYLRDAIRRVIL